MILKTFYFSPEKSPELINLACSNIVLMRNNTDVGASVLLNFIKSHHLIKKKATICQNLQRCYPIVVMS